MKLVAPNIYRHIGRLTPKRIGRHLVEQCSRARLGVTVLITLSVLALPSSVNSAPLQEPQLQTSEIQIPKQSDWTGHGVVVANGQPGSWDSTIAGLSPATVVKKNGVYYLYYIGADGKRSTDGGPRHQALGVATSTDGINFTKYSGNPIITHLPHNNQEEGVFSAAATLDDNGDIVLYYGAIWAATSTTTSVDVYTALAVSQDGLNFIDMGYVRAVAGVEEEPVGVFRANGNWHVYLINNSGWDLHHMSGTSKETFGNGTKILDLGRDIMGGGDPVWLSADKIALFLDLPLPSPQVEIRTVSIGGPNQLSAPVETYNYADHSEYVRGSVFLDRTVNKWFMYYSYNDGAGVRIIGVKTAPAIGGDDTPPTEPTGLTATPISESQIDLSWSSASDPDSGINHYVVYRDGLKVGEPTTTSFSDAGLSEATSYTYEVSAVNGAGLEGAKGIPVMESSLPDTVPPTIVSVASTNSNQLEVVFSEPVEQTSAETTSNYSINNTLSVLSASLSADLKTVTLATSTHSEGATYALAVSNVKDRAKNANSISPDSSSAYTFSSVLVISDLTVASGRAYKVVEYGLETTALVYTDRDFTFTAVPQSVAGSTYIKTANNDKTGTEADFLSFSVNQDVTVYVGYDNRATSLPDWLAGWASTNESVVTTDTSLKLYSKDFPAGQISLGANRAQGASGAGSNYSVMILGKGPAPAPTLLSVQDGQAPVGGSVSIPIVLSEVGADGLAGYDIEVSIANSTIAEIASVDFPAFGITDATPPSGPLLSIRAVDTADLVQAGATNVLLATLNIRGLLEGTTSVNISVTSLDDDLGNPIMTTVISGNLTIVNVAPLVNVGPGVTINTADTYSGSGSITDPGDSAWTATVDYGDGSGVLPLTLSGNTFNLTYVYAQAGMNSPAQDLDGDGHAEDVNGNGRLDFADIVALFEHMDSPQVQNNQSAFDFNDNGRMDMADIIALFDMLVS